MSNERKNKKGFVTKGMITGILTEINENYFKIRKLSDNKEITVLPMPDSINPDGTVFKGPCNRTDFKVPKGKDSISVKDILTNKKVAGKKLKIGDAITVNCNFGVDFNNNIFGNVEENGEVYAKNGVVHFHNVHSFAPQQGKENENHAINVNKITFYTAKGNPDEILFANCNINFDTLNYLFENNIIQKANYIIYDKSKKAVESNNAINNIQEAQKAFEFYSENNEAQNSDKIISFYVNLPVTTATNIFETLQNAMVPHIIPKKIFEKVKSGNFKDLSSPSSFKNIFEFLNAKWAEAILPNIDTYNSNENKEYDKYSIKITLPTQNGKNYYYKIPVSISIGMYIRDEGENAGKPIPYINRAIIPTDCSIQKIIKSWNLQKKMKQEDNRKKNVTTYKQEFTM